MTKTGTSQRTILAGQEWTENSEGGLSRSVRKAMVEEGGTEGLARGGLQKIIV